MAESTWKLKIWIFSNISQFSKEINNVIGILHLINIKNVDVDCMNTHSMYEEICWVYKITTNDWENPNFAIQMPRTNLSATN